MKPFLPREFWLMCAPIALFGAGIYVLRATNPPLPPLDPNAKIQLKVEHDTDYPAKSTGGNLIFAWQAVAQGGPTRDWRFGSAQSLVALGRGKTELLYREPRPITNARVGASSSMGIINEVGGSLSLPYDAVPIWTQKLEWRGDVVALPNSGTPGPRHSWATPATLQQWATIKGATRVTKTIAVNFDPQRLRLISELKLDKVNPANVKLGADICVTTIARNLKRHSFARLIAFDGHTRRDLWSYEKDPHDLWVSQQGTSMTETDWSYLLFKLRDVPASWGEITYLVDPAFDPKGNSFGSDTPCDAGEIARWKQRGWQHFSRRLLVRKTGQTISKPTYSSTPNTDFFGVESSRTAQKWTIKVRLRYHGPDKLYDLDSPSGPEFFEANGKLASFRYDSYGIDKSQRPGEQVMTITVLTKNLGQARAIKMKLQIADSDAAPLIVNQTLQIPGEVS